MGFRVGWEDISLLLLREKEFKVAMDLKDFIVNVLGCGCPQEVLSSINLESSPDVGGSMPLLFRIDVGGRLLVLGVRGDSLLTEADALAQLVALGSRIRDERGFNRLRIVAVSDDPACEAELRSCFETIPGAGDRLHLHVLKEEAVRELVSRPLF
jgi:hypothetical protein